MGEACTEKLLSPIFSLLRTNPSTDSTPSLWKSRHIVGEERPFLESKNDAYYEFNSTPGNTILWLGDIAFPEAIELCAFGRSYLTTPRALTGLAIWNKNSHLSVSISCLSWDHTLKISNLLR